MRHTAADTASHPAADRGQFMLNYDAPKRTPVVINQDPASRLISHFYFQLHFNLKETEATNAGFTCSLSPLVYFYHISNKCITR